MFTNSGILITGTDTGVGKTYVSCLLVQQLIAEGRKVVPIKIISCGGQEDAEDLRAAHGGNLSLEQINPIALAAPLAPYPAAELEGKKINIPSLVDYCHAQEGEDKFIIVEGVGGWEVPLTDKENFSDFAAALRYPVLLVVGNKLGAINHALLSLNAIRQAKLDCSIIINTADKPDIAQQSNLQLLYERAGAHIIGELSRHAQHIHYTKR